jgi:ribosomal protein L24E
VALGKIDICDRGSGSMEVMRDMNGARAVSDKSAKRENSYLFR